MMRPAASLPEVLRHVGRRGAQAPHHNFVVGACAPRRSGSFSSAVQSRGPYSTTCGLRFPRRLAFAGALRSLPSWRGYSDFRIHPRNLRRSRARPRGADGRSFAWALGAGIRFGVRVECGECGAASVRRGVPGRGLAAMRSSVGMGRRRQRLAVARRCEMAQRRRNGIGAGRRCRRVLGGAWQTPAQIFHRRVGADPRSERGEHHVSPVVGEADDRERRQHVGQRAPVGGREIAAVYDGGRTSRRRRR